MAPIQVSWTLMCQALRLMMEKGGSTSAWIPRRVTSSLWRRVSHRRSLGSCLHMGEYHNPPSTHMTSPIAVVTLISWPCLWTTISQALGRQRRLPSICIWTRAMPLYCATWAKPWGFDAPRCAAERPFVPAPAIGGSCMRRNGRDTFLRNPLGNLHNRLRLWWVGGLVGHCGAQCGAVRCGVVCQRRCY